MLVTQLTKGLSFFIRTSFAAPQDIPLVFLVGAPRSGTTMLQRVVGAHPGICTISAETAFFRPSLKPEQLDRFQSNFSTRFRRFCPGSVTADFVASTEHVKERDAHTSAIFCEKTPQHVLSLRALATWFPNAKFVHIVRDGRDAFVSARGHPNVPQRSHVRSFARYWRRCLRSRLALGRHPRIIDVKYEEFCEEPDAVAAYLMDFLGLRFVPTQLKFFREADPRTVPQHFARLTGPIGPESIGKFSRSLDESEIRTFERIAALELQHFGYSTA